MKKEDLTVPAILAEAVGILLCILYIGLQIFYGINYHVAPYKYICMSGVFFSMSMNIFLHIATIPHLFCW